MYDLNDRNSMRQVFLGAWEKRRSGRPLEPLEMMITDIILQHPEYHALLEDTDKALSADYTVERGESNPFLHMAMHLSLQEQVAAGHPNGIRELFRAQLKLGKDPHELEHQGMECLAQVLWTAQSEQTMPDDQAYLNCLKRLFYV